MEGMLPTGRAWVQRHQARGWLTLWLERSWSWNCKAVGTGTCRNEVPVSSSLQASSPSLSVTP